MPIQLIQVPYDSGLKDVRMGNGPAHVVRESVKGRSNADIFVDAVAIEPAFSLEVGTTFRVLEELSAKVRNAVRQQRFPIVLAGGCLSAVGTLAGLDSGATAIVWLDAHGDFNTPETTLSGYLDGMALSACTGHCWRGMTANVPGFQPISEQNVVLLGARDFDPEERALLNSSAVQLIGVSEIRDRGVCAALEERLLRLEGRKVYLHIDLDVLDSKEARVNHFPSSPGLRVNEVLEIASLVGMRLTVAAAAITAYDPGCDHDGKGLRAATALVETLCHIPL